MVLYENGDVYTWGCGIFGQLGTGDTQNQLGPVKLSPQGEPGIRFTHVDCGKRHSMAVDC